MKIPEKIQFPTLHDGVKWDQSETHSKWGEIVNMTEDKSSATVLLWGESFHGYIGAIGSRSIPGYETEVVQTSKLTKI